MTLEQDLLALKQEYYDWEQSGIPLKTVDITIAYKNNKLLEVQNSNNNQQVLTWGAIANGSVSNTASDILLADGSRRAILLHNLSTDPIYISFGSDASLASAMYKIGGGLTLIEKESFVTERLSAIAASGTVSYSLRVAA